MATKGWQAGSAVDNLLRSAQRFDFFQAVGLLEKLAGSAARSLGVDNLPKNESLRFTVNPKLNFPSSAVSSITQPFVMQVAGFGLIGSAGVLPTHYSELILQRKHDKDENLQDFLNIFNHRIISLYYRAWKKYRLNMNSDAFSKALMGLLGVEGASFHNRLLVPDDVLQFYSGLFFQPRSAVGLERILAGYFGLRLVIAQFQGKWLYLRTNEQSRLASNNNNGECYNMLGANAVLGSKFLDLQNKFRIHIGPLSYKTFGELLPSGNMLKPLCELARFYVGINIDFDIRLILIKEEVPRCQLRYKAPFRLGWNSWLKNNELADDVADVVLNC